MRDEKSQMVADLSAVLEASPSFFLITYKGLTAEAFGELRVALAEANASCHVIPNRLFLRAASEFGLPEMGDGTLTGDTALVTGSDEPVAVAKVLRDFAKRAPVLTFKQAMLAGKPCTGADAEKLASMPPLQVLQAQLLGLLQAPPTGLVGVLNAKVASVVYVLTAYLSSKEEKAA